MIVWITKYALTKGILTGEARLCGQGSMIEVPSISRYAYFHTEGRDWHRTEEAAIAKAAQMRDTTIKSLQKRISRLQKLTFVTASRSPKRRKEQDSMKICWAQNPLRTVVLLNDGDRWALREAMETELGPDDDNAYMNDLHAEYEAALRDVHVGDCTCQPCSCLKCHAEAFLEINTIPGLSKHMAHKIVAAFNSQPESTLEEAIAALATYDPRPSSPMWDNKLDLWNACLPGWQEEARHAYAWLIKYRDEHFGDAPRNLDHDCVHRTSP